MDAQSQIAALLKDFLTVAQAAKLLGIKPRAVQTACAKGQLPGAIPFGREWKIPRSAIAARKKLYGSGPIPQAERRNNKPAKDLATAKKSRRK
jgi:excisionase family DNA binding protein